MIWDLPVDEQLLPMVSFALFPQSNHVNFNCVLQTQVVDGYKTLRKRNISAEERKHQHKVHVL